MPTRSALMTGRHPIRTGALQSVPAGLPQGLIPWEITLGRAAAGRGLRHRLLRQVAPRRPRRAAAQRPRLRRVVRHPAHRPTRAMFTSSPGFDPDDRAAAVRDGGRQGRSRRANARGLRPRAAPPHRRRTDATDDRLHARASRDAGTPFFAYVPLTQLHFPTLPHPDFAGRTGAGDFADAMAEMDHRVGEMLDAIDAPGPARGHAVASSAATTARSSAGRGAAPRARGAAPTTPRWKAALRVPFIMRWPGRIAPRRTTDIVHITDLYPTLATLGGARLPTDRPIDGIDQLDFFLGERPTSAREGFSSTSRRSCGPSSGATGRCTSCGRSSRTRGRSTWRRRISSISCRTRRRRPTSNMEGGWVRGPMRRMIECVPGKPEAPSADPARRAGRFQAGRRR